MFDSEVSRLSNPSVLIVDDAAIMRFSMSLELGFSGFRSVYSAENYSDALEILSRFRPQFLICGVLIHGRPERPSSFDEAAFCIYASQKYDVDYVFVARGYGPELFRPNDSLAHIDKPTKPGEILVVLKTSRYFRGATNGQPPSTVGVLSLEEVRFVEELLGTLQDNPTEFETRSMTRSTGEGEVEYLWTGLDLPTQR